MLNRIDSLPGIRNDATFRPSTLNRAAGGTGLRELDPAELEQIEGGNPVLLGVAVGAGIAVAGMVTGAGIALAGVAVGAAIANS